MSSPSINRWGLNLFWYRFWYNDKINSLLNHQDHLINKFILIYIHYGLLCPKNFFINTYWYTHTTSFFKVYREEIYTKYFRIAQFKNRTTREQKSYKIRTKYKNLYFSKIWILRYQNWIVVNFYCFQPLKKKNVKTRMTRRDVSTNLSRRADFRSTFLRYRLISSFFCNYFFTKNFYYKF